MDFFKMKPAQAFSDAIARARGFVLSFKHSKSRRKIAANVFSLSLLQYASYVFPLITVPYLTRVIGVEMFGLVAFAQATVAYFGMMVNYGFSYTAPRQVAIHRDDKVSLRQIFSQVMWTKLLLAGLGLVLLGGFLAVMPEYRKEALLFLASYAIVIGFVFTSEWFFQGLEEMKYITIAGLISRTAATLLIFVFVRSRVDYVFVPLITAAGTLAGALYGQWVIWKNFRIVFGPLDLAAVWRQLREGWDVFVSSAFISLYTTTNIFTLGLLTNSTQVGYYSAAERTVAGIRSLWGPIPQALYPHFSKVFSYNVESGRRQLRKVAIFSGGATLFLSLAGCLFAPLIVRLYLGSAFLNSTIIVQVLVFTVVSIGVSNVLGIHGLLANGENVAFRNIVLVAGILNIGLLLVFVKFFGVLGPAISVVIVETLIAVVQWIVLRKKKLV